MDNVVERHKRGLSEEHNEDQLQQDNKRVRPLFEAVAAHLSGGNRMVPDGEQQQAGVANAAAVHPLLDVAHHHPPSPPASDQSDADDDHREELLLPGQEEEEEPSDENFVLAGYEYCSKEAIRYLLEEEKLDDSHPVIQQLQQHLDIRRSQVQSLNSAKPPSSSNAP